MRRRRCRPARVRREGGGARGSAGALWRLRGPAPTVDMAALWAALVVTGLLAAPASDFQAGATRAMMTAAASSSDSSCAHGGARMEGGFPGAGMVLERNGSRLWGITPFPSDTVHIDLTGSPGAHLRFAASTTLQPSRDNATSYWRWEVTLPPLPVGGSLNLTVSSTGSAVHGCAPSVYTDVTVGQVWLCSGQSNIAFGLGSLTNASHEAAAAAAPWGDNIRMWDAGHWTKASAEGGNATLKWSAECYLFARHLHALDPAHPPIGLTTMCSGGTGIEYWLPPDSFVADPTPTSNGSVMNYFFGRQPQLPNGLPQPGRPGGGWNRSISTLLAGPATLTGVYWHQGEANTVASACELEDGDWYKDLTKEECANSPHAGGDGGEMGYSMVINEPKGAVWYAKQFPSMIESYRTHFQNPQMKFLWTNLQAYNDGHTGIEDGKWCTSKADCWKDCAQGKGDCGTMGFWNGTSIAALRAAQTKALALPHTAEALAFDMTDPENGVHPHDSKCELGRRLAKAAIMLDLKDAGAAAIPEAMRPWETPTLVGHSVVQLPQQQPNDTESATGGSVVRLEFGKCCGDATQLHLAPAMHCDNVSTVISSEKFNYAAGSPHHKTREKCCEWSPFEVISTRGDRLRPTATVKGVIVTLPIPAGFGSVKEVRYGYQDIVLCALYLSAAGGGGGGDSKMVGATGNQSLAMPARPFRIIVNGSDPHPAPAPPAPGPGPAPHPHPHPAPPPAPASKRYYCDPQGGERGACLDVRELPGTLAPTTPIFSSASCNASCPDTAPHRCSTDWDCSLAGDCVSGACVCDAWATGDDCSYLNMLPVDPDRLGYLDPVHSSWGGTVLHSAKDKQWHMYMAEIDCPNGTWGRPIHPGGPPSGGPGKAGGQTRCGLGNWGGSSQVAHAVASHPAGPYQRQELVLGQEHHNPETKVSPFDGSWNIYSITHTMTAAGRPVTPTHWQIAVASSTDQGASWDVPPLNNLNTPNALNLGAGTIISPEANPCPVLHKNGTMSLFYEGLSDLPPPKCSNESIGVQYCRNRTGGCNGGTLPITCSVNHSPPGKPISEVCPRGSAIFNHSAEDPSIFQTRRGWHMLVNALPGGCHPQESQGGHAWSHDGVTWSDPRIGGYNGTISFPNGTSMNCRRERPQILLDPESGEPIGISNGVQCPRSFGVFTGSKNLGGNMDSYTSVQMLNGSQAKYP